MFDIVPSPGPQSQVLNPARASVFVHSLCSVNTVRGRHPLQVSPPQLLNSCSHGNSLAPATSARHPSQVLTGLWPTHNPQLPTLRSEKGSARPAVTYPQLLYRWRHLPARKDYIIYMYSPNPNLTHIVAIAYINMINLGTRNTVINGNASSSQHSIWGVACLASNA